MSTILHLNIHIGRILMITSINRNNIIIPNNIDMMVYYED